MSARRPLVAGNWKLNGSRSTVVELATAVAGGIGQLEIDVVLCPTSLHLPDVVDVVAFSNVRLGAQSCSEHREGAFTGEVSPQMLDEYGCEFVIVGHSERRALYAESDEVVAAKCMNVLSADLVPILCVGETLQQREAGQVGKVIGAQLDAVLKACSISAFGSMVVAYEPVWAIGTGQTASPEQAQEVHALIRNKLAEIDGEIASALRVLYGGSVKPDNAQALFSQPDIDGGLIGGASLDADAFLSICQAAA